MHLVIVVPSPEHVTTAGVRIRYQRLGEELASRGATFDIVAFADLAALDTPPTAVIFSKVFSFGAIATMARLRSAGVTIAIDVFDDYFSQSERADLARYRRWLRAALANIDIAICSTARIAHVLGDVHPGLPVFRMPDTLEPTDLSELRALATDKAVAARASGTLKVLWFGIGDNRFFQVGLEDVIATADHLAALADGGWTVELTILTNLPSITPERAAGLARLPVMWRVEPWSIAAETEALASTTIAFLPVNGQNFSRAKTLNRAMTAARAGCQILSVGYPLYEELSDYVYTDAEALLGDFAQERLAIRPATCGALLQRMSDLGDRISVARALVDTLASVKAGATGERTIVAIAGHVAELPIDEETLTMRAPFTRSKMAVDIHPRLNAAKNRYDIWVGRRVVALMLAKNIGLADELTEKGEMFRLPPRYSRAAPTMLKLEERGIGLRQGPYLDLVAFCRAIVVSLLPEAQVAVLERDGLCNHWLERAGL